MPKFQTTGATNLDFLAARLGCETGREIRANIRWLVASNLPTLAGTAGWPPNLYFAGPAHERSPIVWMLLCVGLTAGLFRASAIAWPRRMLVPPIFVFLGLVGLQTVAAYVTACNVRDPMLIRYTLVTLLVPVAVAGWYLHAEHRRALRVTVILLIIAWAGWSVTQYAPLDRALQHEPRHSPTRRGWRTSSCVEESAMRALDTGTRTTSPSWPTSA